MKPRIIGVAILLALIPTVSTAASLPARTHATPRLTISPHCYVVGHKTRFTIILRGVGPNTRHEFFRGPLSNLPMYSEKIGTFRASKYGTLGMYLTLHYTSMSSSLHGMWSLFLEPPGTVAIKGDGTPHAHFKVVGSQSQC